MQINEITARKALDNLAYILGRIGRAISAGGRRMDRLVFETALREKNRLQRPEVEGRKTPRGSFKEITRALASGTNTDWAKARSRPIKPSHYTTRNERRASKRDALHQIRKLHRGTGNQEQRPTWQAFKNNGVVEA